MEAINGERKVHFNWRGALGVFGLALASLICGQSIKANPNYAVNVEAGGLSGAARLSALPSIVGNKQIACPDKNQWQVWLELADGSGKKVPANVDPNLSWTLADPQVKKEELVRVRSFVEDGCLVIEQVEGSDQVSK